MSESLLAERDGGVVVARLNRPQRRNALNVEILEALDRLLGEVEGDESARALIVTGNDQAFCAGQDLKEPETPDYVPLINRVFNRLEALPKVTIAAIDGWCIAGGLELALCCDFRVATPAARIGDWHVRINSIGGAGATVRLTRLLGAARAKELILSGDVLEGEAARNAGLVSRLFASEELLRQAKEFAGLVTVGHPLTVSLAKQAIQSAADLPLQEALAVSLDCQNRLRNAVGLDSPVAKVKAGS